MTKKISSVHYPSRQYCPSLFVCGISYSCPHQLLVEWNLGLWCSHLGEEGCKRFDEIEKANCDGSVVLFLQASFRRTATHDCYRAVPSITKGREEKVLKRR